MLQQQPQTDTLKAYSSPQKMKPSSTLFALCNQFCNFCTNVHIL